MVISVLMPVRNGERFIRPAIESVLAQTEPRFELLVINDGSTDSTRAIVADYADGRIRILDNPRSLGIAASLNRGIAEAKGGYLAQMHGDDICHPERFRRQLAFIEAHPSVSVVGCAAELMDESGSVTGVLDLPVEPRIVRWECFFRSPLIHPAVMARRAAVVGAGGYRTDLVATEDFDLWVRLAACSDLANLPDRLLRVRQHAMQVSQRRLQTLEQEAEDCACVETDEDGVCLRRYGLAEGAAVPSAAIVRYVDSAIALFEARGVERWFYFSGRPATDLPYDVPEGCANGAYLLTWTNRLTPLGRYYRARSLGLPLPPPEASAAAFPGNE